MEEIPSINTDQLDAKRITRGQERFFKEYKKRKST